MTAPLPDRLLAESMNDVLAAMRAASSQCAAFADRIEAAAALSGREAVEAARDAAIQQAQQWKMEAETANATIAEIYRLVGSKAGNWNGAQPVRDALTTPQPGDGVDAARLDWLRDNEFDLVTRREDIDEDEYRILWFVIDPRKTTRRHLHSISGHPVGSPREAIDAAIARSAAPSAKGVANG